VAVRLFVGNMPYGATEADLRTHFSGVGEPSQIVIPVDRETGRPRGFAFVEFLDRAMAEAAVERFNQQPFMGRSLSVSEARPRDDRPAGGGFGARPPGAGGFTPRPPGGGFGGPPRPSGGFGGPPRPGGAPGGFRPSGPPGAGSSAIPGRNFGPPKKKGAGGDKRWDNKDRGPRGPIKERYTGRLGGLYDDPKDSENAALKDATDFDDIAARAPDDDNEG
jgi:cold-inducible RNA-binding protein